MIDLGIVKPGSTLYVPFQTYSSDDPQASMTITGLATTDIEIYKDGSVTQRASDSGYALLDTDGIDFDTITGIHGVSIDLADNTTAGFFAAGSQYWVVISSITLDAATINFIPITFRIGYPDAFHNTTIATLSSQTSFTLTAGPAEDDALNGCIVAIHDVASSVQMGFAVVSDYVGSTKTITLTAGTTFTAAATDNISFYPPANVSYIGATAQTANDIGADINSILSDTTIIASDVVIIGSDLVLVYSDTTAIEAGGGALTAAQDSKLTKVTSDVVIIGSDIIQIYSDTTAINTQTTTIASDLVQVYSDTTIIVSDTTAINTQTTTIASDVVQIYSDTTIIASDVVLVYSDTTAIHSQTTVIESDTTVIEGVLPTSRVAVAVTFTAGTTTTATLGNVNGSAASSSNDYYNGRVLVFDSGTLANQVTDITDYVGSTKVATITAVTTAVTSSHTAIML